ncbi:MAG: dCTP deaminase [Candidatus Brocadiae bacterium]|nr:dCTP deaminase [Candidatus Brocadiia bacterium]
MCILTKEEILKEIHAGHIVVDPFRPECVGPASIDLHLSSAFRIFHSPRKIMKVTDDGDYRDITYGVCLAEGESILLMPNETILGITEEKITLPENICGWLEGRSKFARMGLLVHISASFMQPGISNHQVLEMSNFGPVPLDIYPKTSVCQFIFQKTLGNARYQGSFRNQCPKEFAG